MSQTSRFWDGTTNGDATVAPYDFATEVSEVLNALAGSLFTVNKGGIFHGQEGSLNCSGTSSPLNIDPGQALVYGGWFHNDSAIAQAVATPVSATRIDLITVRKTWNSQQIRLNVQTGTEGGSAPTVVQSIGNTWDIPVAQWSITTGGVITVTDMREFVGPNSVRISKTKLSAAQANITITPPSTLLGYDNLRIVLIGRMSGAVATGTIGMQFATGGGAIDTGANYDSERATGINAAAAATNQLAATSMVAGIIPGASAARANIIGHTEIRIPNYGDTSFEKVFSYKSAMADSTAANSSVANGGGSWRNTGGITSIVLTPSSGNFAANTEYEVWAE